MLKLSWDNRKVLMSEERVLFCSYADFLNPITDRYYDNSGNTVFYSAGVSYFYSNKLQNVDIPINAWEKIENEPDWINKNFDMLIYMEANVFSKTFKENMKAASELIEKIKIPVYVLGAGAQSDVDYSFDFIKDIDTEAKRYIDAILATGGTFTLRGEFTKEVLSKLGYNNFFVSGCPSLFYQGKNLNITNKKVSKEEFKPMLNGTIVSSINDKIYNDCPKSAFFDQGLYFDVLFRPDIVKNFDDMKYQHPFKKLYKQKRILGNMNPYLWRKQIEDGGFNFSYGTRIHGNIIALQEKIPAFVKVIDSRTREMAEFFKIPNSILAPPQHQYDESKDNLYDLYKSLNYDEFNSTLSIKFDAFKKFLNDNNIPNVLGENDEFKEHISKLDYPKEIEEIKIDKKVLKKLPDKFNLYKLLVKIMSFFIPFKDKRKKFRNKLLSR